MNYINIAKVVVSFSLSLLILLSFGLLISIVDFQSTELKRIAESGEDGVSYFQVVGRARTSLDQLRKSGDRQKKLQDLQEQLKKKNLEILSFKNNFDYYMRVLSGKIDTVVSNFNCLKPEDIVSFDIDSCKFSSNQVVGEISENIINQSVSFDVQINEAKEIQNRVIKERENIIKLEGEIEELNQKIDELSVSPEFTDSLHGEKINSVIKGTMLELNIIDSRISFLSYLVYLPPLLCAILLVAVSGSIGSLIMILFMKVYPVFDDKEFVQNRGVGEFNRVALGGLVSVAIFLAMGSTTLVLDPGSALSGGLGTNAVSLSFIGILGGVFSAKVARWLSDRIHNMLQAPSTSGQTPPTSGQT